MSPGVALGIRMAEIALKKIGFPQRGKGLIGIAETRMCIPDALQAVAGTTPGNKRLIIIDYGKLALSIVRSDTMEGYRVTLKRDTINRSNLVKKFILREGKLSKDEMVTLSKLFLELDEESFKAERIKINFDPHEPKKGIVECSQCKELQPENYMVFENGRVVCKSCACGRYYTRL